MNARAAVLAKKKSIKKSVSKKSAKKRDPIADRPIAPGYGIVGSKDGKGLLPWSWITKKMNACRTFWLATIYSGENRPHVMPIWGVWVDDAFYFSTGRKSRKGKNLAANNSCTVSNDDSEQAVIVDGEATEVHDTSALERVALAYMKKYKIDPRSMNEPIFELLPKKVFGLIEKSYPKTATRWRP